VAQFFHLICTAIFEDLLRSHSDKMGALGQVSSHFGVVETNGRGMLHLHTFIWATGFPKLREQVLQDENFRADMIHFLESIIIQSVQSLPDRSGMYPRSARPVCSEPRV
jgi:Helitron helicase-like domain at N-terminus